MRTAVVALLALLLAAPTLAGPPPRAVFVAAGTADDAPCVSPARARVGAPVTLYAVVVEGTGRRARYFTDAPTLRVRGRRVPAKALRPFAALGPAAVTWALVEPRQHHQATLPPNEGNPAYSNCVLFGPRHGRWLGYDVLEYHETPVEGASGSTLTVDRATPTDPYLHVHAGLGTMRYKATVTMGEVVLASPGAEAVGPRGILPDVARVTFRGGDDLAGFLRGYFNVPNVFGSSGPSSASHQTDLFQGADCADVIVGALRQAGARVSYTSAAGLTRYARPVTPRLVVDETGIRTVDGKDAGAPVTLAFGRDVRVGDIVLLDYVGFTATGRDWDHVGVLAADHGAPGALDAADTLLHIGYLYGLAEDALLTQAPVVIQVLRLKPAYQRQLDRAAKQARRGVSR